MTVQDVRIARVTRTPSPGRSFPLGASLEHGGANFSVFAKYATGVELVLFDERDPARIVETIPLEPLSNRTYHYWHVFVPGVAAGQHYGYRVSGPYDPARGMRFDREKVLLDPYARAVTPTTPATREAGRRPGDDAATALKGIVVDAGAYDWEGDTAPGHPFAKSIIYEMHVRGFTMHPSSGVDPELRGTYAGLIEKVPYLVDLGVSAVELMPVFAFDEHDAPAGMPNYWGYQPVSFFAPHVQYSARRDAIGPLNELRDMVKALHRAGIEVLLDVVYNHTAEGGADGPTLSFRGLSNPTYYILGEDKAQYADYTGCGNTLNANEPIVRRLIVDSLRYWVTEMHVDGFRFDLASVLSRDRHGVPLPAAPVLWDIESDPILANVKLVAEAWDAAGLYQVGQFTGDSWKDWNGRFRDDVRAFLKSDEGRARAIALRVTGSPDLYTREDREPEQSINFVACHDGFTLNDLVSYNQKHNEQNGEGNRDGNDANLSWNCGVEGPSGDPEIERLRNQQVKNFLTLTLLSIGTPMLLMGDEVRRTQRGNNNAYCQDNETSWFDWSLLDEHADVHRFARHLIGFRRMRNLIQQRLEMSLNELMHQHIVEWHGVRRNAPDWSETSHTVALTATMPLVGIPLRLHVIVNAFWEPLSFELPSPGEHYEPWRRCIDTSLPSPDDARAWVDAPAVEEQLYRADPRSVVVLASMPRA